MCDHMLRGLAVYSRSGLTAIVAKLNKLSSIIIHMTGTRRQNKGGNASHTINIIMKEAMQSKTNKTNSNKMSSKFIEKI